MSRSFASIEMDVLRWGEARGIVQNGKPMGQAKKTLEEAGELIEGIAEGDLYKTIDALGDVLVTLVMVAATSNLNLTDCFEHAYQQIKDRKGYLRPDGVFVKEA
jgi:phosphoribosyl-ATP pyrophosphohydrolase